MRVRLWVGMAAKRFGKYVLLEKVAAGGMAEIFRAKTYGVSGFEKDLAVKRILPHLSEDEVFVEMLVDEAKITVALSHPNIAQIFDLGRVKNQYFIAMEYVSGKDLGRTLRACHRQKQKLPREHALYTALQVCNGLAYAHSKKGKDGQPLNIIHRDVSPQNILISFDGHVKIVDFGIAKAANRAGVTQMGEIKGKFAYMSPEQARGEALDNRSDVFAAGILLHEMLTGARAFFHGSDAKTLRSVQECKFRTFEELGVEVDEDLKAIVYRALTGDRELRYQEASAMAADLTRYVNTRNPGYSPAKLAEFMQGLFADEIEEAKRRKAREDDLDPGEAIEDAEIIDEDVEQTAVTPMSQGATLSGMPPLTPATGVSVATPLPQSRTTSLLFGLLGAALVAAVAAALLSGGFLGGKTGGLRIDSDPQGASLIIDGMERAQRTPALIEGFEPGRHRVAVVYPDGRRWEGDTEVQPGSVVRVSVPALPPLVGGFKISSTTENTLILIDGMEAGQAPFERNGFPIGKHKVTAQAEGWIKEMRVVTIEADQVAEVSFDLKPDPAQQSRTPRAYGHVNINSVPWAKIYIDGRDTGRTTPATGIRLNVGRHRIRLVNPDAGLEKTATLTVKKGETHRIAERLE